MDYDNNKVKLPKVEWVSTKLHLKFSGIGNTASVSAHLLENII